MLNLRSPQAQLCITLFVGLILTFVSVCAKSIEGNIVQNADFDEPGAKLPLHWIMEDKIKHKGKVSVAQAAGGNRFVTLQPNSKNLAAELESNPMGIGQVFSLQQYPNLRGATLHVSARMGAIGKTSARLRLIAIRSGGQFLGTTLQQDSSDGALIEHSGRLMIPDDSKNLFVVIGLDATGTAGKAMFDDVYLGLTPAPSQALLGQNSQPAAMARIRIDAGQPIRQIPETLYGLNMEWAWDGGGLWDGPRAALDENIVQLTKAIRPSTIRYPGGIFADFYHWRDGIGPRNKRPTTAHFPEGPVSKHNLGTDEALEFASLTGAELMITANIASGTVEEAVEWLRYVNQPDQTKGQPPRVKYWEIGNENYYYGGSTHVNQAAHDARQYSDRVIEFATAMKKADPRISIIAIAEENFMRDFQPVHSDWYRLLLTKAANLIDYVAVHNGYVPGLARDYDLDVRTIYHAMLAAPIQLRASLDRVSAQIKKYAPAHASRIKIAVTEWSPSFQIVLDGPYLDHPKTLGSALFVASNIKNYIEHPDVDIANYFKLNDRLWAGMLSVRNDRFVGTAPYYAFRMYREHFGSVLIKTETESPTYNTNGAGYVGAHQNVPYLDVVSSLSADGRHLYVMVINKHFDQDIPARIDLAGFKPGAKGSAFVLTGSGIDANTGTELFKAPGMKWAKQASDAKNPRFDKGGPNEISVTSQIAPAGPGFEFKFKKHSVTAIVLDRDG